MKKITLIIICCFLLRLNAQPPLRFYTTFGGYGDDIGYSGRPTLDKQYIVAGSTSSYGQGNTDMYLVKVDSMGTVIWAKFFGGFGNEAGKSVIQLPDSGYVIAGFTNSFGNGGYDAYIVRTDKAGNLIWQRTFGGGDWDFANDLVQGADGNLFVVGYTFSFGHGKKDGFLLKYDIGGDLIWSKLIGGAENEELNSIIKTNDNFLATVGYTESGKDINGDGYFMKLDLNGDTIFTKTFGGAYRDYAKDVVHKQNNDNYFIVGASTPSLNSVTKSYMYLMSNTGVLQLEELFYNSKGDEEFVSLANSNQFSHLTGLLRNVPVPNVAMQGNLIIAHQDGYVYKVNSFGWYQDEAFYSVEGTSDGGYVCLGSTYSFNSIGKDVFFIKLDSTIYHYDNLVGIQKNQNTDLSKINIKYLGQSIVQIEFPQQNIPEKADLIGLDGKLIKEFKLDHETLELDLSEYDNRLFIIRFKYANGSIHHEKLINR